MTTTSYNPNLFKDPNLLTPKQERSILFIESTLHVIYTGKTKADASQFMYQYFYSAKTIRRICDALHIEYKGQSEKESKAFIEKHYSQMVLSNQQ